MKHKESTFPLLYTWREFCFAMLVAIVVILFTGCSQLAIVRSAVDIKGQEVADRALADAEFVMCRGVSVGAWVRHYGRDAALAEAWKTLCGSESLLTTPTITK